MKSITKFTTATLITSLVGATLAHAAQTATGNVSATVIGPLAITQTTPLSFGSFSSSATAGTIDHFGRTTGGVTYLNGATFGLFNVTGNPNTSFNITGPASAVTLTSGANTMSAALTVPTTSALTALGTQEFSVTGVLTVAANQASGAYTGTYNVSVNY